MPYFAGIPICPLSRFTIRDVLWQERIAFQLRQHPDKVVVSIDYNGKKSETPAAPFCVAMTAEK
jgi:hypothetical protein